MATRDKAHAPHRLPDRRKALWRTPGSLLWALKTVAQKRLIALQDRRGSYSYSRWIREVERPAIRRAVDAARRLRASRTGPHPAGSACFLVVVARGEWDLARQTVESILALDDAELALRLLVPADLPPEEAAALRGLLARDERFRLVLCPDPADPAGWPAAVEGANCAWVVPLRAGDQIAPAWADLFPEALARRPDADWVYWDEDRLVERERSQPFFKPDWSPELLLQMDYAQTGAFRARLFRDSAGAGPAWTLSAAEAARAVSHIPFVLVHRAAAAPVQSPAARGAWMRAVRSALEWRGPGSAQPAGDEGPRIPWDPPFPTISIIIPTRNNLEYLRRCLSTLLEKTEYPDYEVLLMDDHSSDPAVLAYYEEVQAAYPQVRVHANEGPFNYSRVNNRGAALAQGRLLLFLNNDVEILEPGWLKELARWVLLPGVGMTGARLLYPDGTIQHSGVVVGMTGHAGHIYQGQAAPWQAAPWQAAPFSGLFPSPDCARNVSAVTGACMLVRSEVFSAVGGFDESLGLVFNDIDLGVRFIEAGWRVVYTPASTLIHYEGRSRAKTIPDEDIRRGAERLAAVIRQGDPYYNPNLSTAVSWPTLRRPFEPSPADRLADIVRHKG